MGFKNIFYFLTVLSFSIASLADVGLDARMDHVFYDPSDEVGKPAYETNQISRLKIDFQGKLGEKIKFRLRLDPLKVDSNATAKQTTVRDKTSPFIDFAYVSRFVSENATVTMGKIITGMGGIEGTVNPGDLYLRSAAGDEAAAISWTVGIQLQGQSGLHDLRLNFGNVTEDVTDASGNLSSTRSLAGLTYTSKMMDGVIQPNLSYHAENYDGGATGAVTGHRNQYSAVGSRFVFDSFELEVDYLSNQFSRDPQVATNVLGTRSGVALIRYKILDFGSVHFKYEETARTTAMSATEDTTSMINGQTLAFEYRPVQDENWRAFFALTQKETQPESGSRLKENFSYVGLRILANFL